MLLIKLIRGLLLQSKGSATVLVAMSMVALIGACSLVVDIGALLLAKHRLGNALDAAVLAGAQELPDAPANALIKATDYFCNHGFDVANLSNVSAAGDNKSVTASGQVTVNYALAGVLGISSSIVKGSATAGIEPLTAVRGVVPVGIQDQELIFNQEYQLKIASNNSFSEYLGPGNFGVLALAGSGSSTYENTFKHGYNGKIKIGDVIDTETGNKSGATRDGITYRVGQCDHACTPTQYDPSCPRLVIIPIYIPEIINGNKVVSVRVVGLATFLLSLPGDKLVGNESYVKGYFVRTTVYGESDLEAGDYGAYSVKLTS